jgi:beta-glucosidase
MVMTDWGATNDRVEGVKAGLDLEMPSSNGANDAKIVAAVKDGSLTEAALDIVAIRVVDLILKAQEFAKANYKYNADAQHQLARRAAAESAVLLKNDGNLLPLAKGKTIALIGAFAKTPRYQGAGSSKINPLKIDSPFDGLTKAGLSLEYAQGYALGADGTPDDKLIQEAVELAKKKDFAIVVAGLPDEYESEGFDRTNMDMPASHNKLIEAVAQANPNTIVVLQLGAPAALPWAPKVKGILLAYLGGQAGGGAIADLLTGAAIPTGKLAETWPVSLADNPSYKYFPGGTKTVEYRESIFVGYRYYEAANKPVAYPFGYGLSYTSFEYSGLKLDRSEFRSGGILRASVTVKNTGSRRGAEIVQLYVAKDDSKIYRAKKELKGFEKVWLDPGQSKTVTLVLDTRSFAYYNVPDAAWAVEGGAYTILIGASSQDIKLKQPITVVGDGREAALADQKAKAPEYFNLKNEALTVSDASFQAVYGQPLPHMNHMPGDLFTPNSTFADFKDTEIGKVLLAKVIEGSKEMFGGGNSGGDATTQLMLENMMTEMPLRAMGMMGGGKFPPEAVGLIVDALNGKPSPALAQLLG